MFSLQHSDGTFCVKPLKQKQVVSIRGPGLLVFPHFALCLSAHSSAKHSSSPLPAFFFFFLIKEEKQNGMLFCVRNDLGGLKGILVWGVCCSTIVGGETASKGLQKMKG